MSDTASPAGVVVGLNAVIVAVTDERPRILIVDAATSTAGEVVADALPFGPLDPAADRTLELALRRWVRGQAGIEVGYVEQLYTFGDKNRDPREREGGPRVLSIGYLSLVREDQVTTAAGSRWHDWYAYLPWEDWRHGRPAVLDALAPAFERWVAAADDVSARRLRRERVDIAFGLHGAPWDGYRVLDRYELVYEAEQAAEAWIDRGVPVPGAVHEVGRSMRADHRRILATAMSRLRGKIKYRPVVFELLPPTFTLLQLQRVVEALAGQPLHKQNFRRLVEKGGLVEGTGKTADTGGRPAELFHFRREVLRERPTPGVGLPGLPQIADRG
ncbi:MAG: NAD regulator [Acidobacteriota bacterium]